MGDRLATMDTGQKVGRSYRGGLGPTGSRLTLCGLGRGLPLYQVWRLDPSNRLATTVGLPSPPRRNTLTDYFIPSLVVKTFTVRVH